VRSHLPSHGAISALCVMHAWSGAPPPKKHCCVRLADVLLVDGGSGRGADERAWKGHLAGGGLGAKATLEGILGSRCGEGRGLLASKAGAKLVPALDQVCLCSVLCTRLSQSFGLRGTQISGSFGTATPLKHSLMGRVLLVLEVQAWKYPAG
jgi:hypothetical protein